MEYDPDIGLYYYNLQQHAVNFACQSVRVNRTYHELCRNGKVNQSDHVAQSVVVSG